MGERLEQPHMQEDIPSIATNNASVHPWTCYLCGQMPPYQMAGERIYVLDAGTRTVAMVCAECIDATVYPVALAKWRKERSDG